MEFWVSEDNCDNLSLNLACCEQESGRKTEERKLFLKRINGVIVFRLAIRKCFSHFRVPISEIKCSEEKWSKKYQQQQENWVMKVSEV